MPAPFRALARLIVVPIVVMGVLTLAFASPDDNHGTATAAVVNHDEPVTVNGKTVPLGRLLAGNLTHSDDSPYTWVLTDADDAAGGLADGHYAAAVTIPESFSAQATSAATADPLDATQAVLRIQTTAAAGVADPTLAALVAHATQQALNTQIVETYLDNVYIAFTTIHRQLNQAADGADQLADGTTELRDAADQLADGADQLAVGTTRLASGSGTLATGLTQAERDTAQLPVRTRELADGAKQVAAGNEQLAATLVPLANRIIRAIDALPSARTAAAEFRDLATECPTQGGSTQFCDGLSRAANRFTRDAATIDRAKARIRAAVVKARDSVTALASGARQVADGNTRLAAAMPALVDGIADAATGARQLHSGARQVDTGARKLATGSAQLADGVGQVDDGARELADKLDKGRDQVPAYTDEERTHLAVVAATPSTATTDQTPINTLAVTVVAAVALWVLALATYIVTRPTPETVLTDRAPTWRIILGAALPGATTAALAAVAITAMAVLALHLGFGRALGFLLVTLVAAVTFTAVNQAVAALLGRNGRYASITVLTLAAATGIVSTLPGPLYTIAGYLPTSGAVLALRAVATGGPGLATGITQLVVWLAAGALATILVTDRRRYLSPRRIRPGTFLIPA